MIICKACENTGEVITHREVSMSGQIENLTDNRPPDLLPKVANS